MTVLTNARQSVVAPVRRPRRFGLFSVVTPIEGETHWLLGGLTSDGEECSKPTALPNIVCGPSAPKSSRSWYSDIEGDPWGTYMYETCKTIGRIGDSAAKLRERFLASEESAVEDGMAHNLLIPGADTATATDALDAIGQLESLAAADYGGQPILFLTHQVAAQAGTYLIQAGDHLETLSGSLVAVGNFSDDGSIHAAGGVALYRTPLMVTGPAVNTQTNDYYVLAERVYAGLLDCWHATATVGP